MTAMRALASERRLLILEWLKDPQAHFRPQIDGDLVKDGVCGVLIAEKLGVSQPTVSEHLKVLSQAGLLRAKRIKQWTFYRRDEARIRVPSAEINCVIRELRFPTLGGSWSDTVTCGGDAIEYASVGIDRRSPRHPRRRSDRRLS